MGTELLVMIFYTELLLLFILAVTKVISVRMEESGGETSGQKLYFHDPRVSVVKKHLYLPSYGLNVGFSM